MIIEVNGVSCAEDINRLNGLFPDDFLPLKPKHLARGFWWLAYDGDDIVGFAGMVPFEPFPRVGYMKRAAVLDGYRGRGFQRKFIEARLKTAAIKTDWTHIVSSCAYDNVASANNFIRSGFLMTDVERPWEKKSIFWIKSIEERD